jgi:hypothetical protein
MLLRKKEVLLILMEVSPILDFFLFLLETEDGT